MEKIDTDYKRLIWKIEAKLFNMRKPWLSFYIEWVEFYWYASQRAMRVTVRAMGVMRAMENEK